MATGFTQDALDKLEAAIAEGVRVVKYSDKQVEYQSVADMLRVRDLMKRQIGGETSITTRRIYAETSKGLG